MAEAGLDAELRSGRVIVREKGVVRLHDRRHDLAVRLASQQPGAHRSQIGGWIDQPQRRQPLGVADRTLGARVALHADPFGARRVDADAVIGSAGEHAHTTDAGRVRDGKLHRHVGTGRQAGDGDAIAAGSERGQAFGRLHRRDECQGGDRARKGGDNRPTTNRNPHGHLP
ncbi:MAG: hypothetical protein MUD07_12550 [Burkholderiaceae bacterium]|nr:hypothetical protein [Burkholderiaceae bacterium]